MPRSTTTFLRLARPSPSNGRDPGARGMSDDGGFGGRHGTRAELAEGAAGGLAPDLAGGIELGEVAARGPVKAAPVLAAGVRRDGDDAERRVRPLVARAKAARQDDGDAARGAAEGRALAIRDARVERERGGLPFPGDRDGARGVDAAAGRIVEVEVRRARGVAEELGVGGAGEGVFLGEVRELDGVGDEALDARLGEVARGGSRDALSLDDPQPGGAGARLLDELGLAFADARGELGARAQDALRDEVLAAALLRHPDDAVTELE